MLSSNGLLTEDNEDDCELLLHDTHLEICDSLEFWKSIRSLSLQEKSLYHDIDYSRGKVNLKKEKRLAFLRHMRRVSFLLFSTTLLSDYVYTMYKAIQYHLWKICIIHNFVFSMLLVCLVSKEPLRLLVFGILFIFARLKTNKHTLLFEVNAPHLFITSIVFFFFFYFFDQIIELSKSK